MEPSRPTVLLADDHAAVLASLSALLEQDFDVVGAVGNGHLLMEAARQLRPDVIVTDISMPGLSVLEALSCLNRECIASKVIVLTMYLDADLAVRAIAAGASGYVLKNKAGTELEPAIRQVLQNRIYLTSAVSEQVSERFPGQIPHQA